MTIATVQPGVHELTEKSDARHGTERFPKTVRTLLWTLVLLSALEGGLRMRSWIRHGASGPVSDLYVDDARLGRRLRPEALIEGTTRKVRIDSFGFRGPEISLIKPPGTLRIATIGDSTTFGMEASSDDATWVRRMEAFLNANDDPSLSDRGRRFEAINAAIPGFTLETAGLHFFNDVERFSPDVVVVTALATDIAAHSRRQFGGQARKLGTTTGMSRWLGEHSLLVNLLRQNTAAFRARQFAAVRHDRLDDEGVARYRQALEQLVDRCVARGIQPILSTWARAFRGASHGDQYTLATTALANNPALSLKGLNDAFDRYNEAIREVAQEKGVVLVDLDRLVPAGEKYFADAIHLNDAGHALVGRLMAEAIIKSRPSVGAGGD